MKSFFVVIFSISSLILFAQSETKMKNNFRIKINPEFDATQLISFDHTVAGKHGFDKVTQYFTQGFEKEGFTITNANPRYVVMMDYGYGWALASYKMQYSDLVAEIQDTQNNNKIVGTFKYTGRYDNEYLGPAIAKELKALVEKSKK